MCAMNCASGVRWPLCCLEQLWSRCSASGVEFKHKHGRKLVGDSTAKSRLLYDVITESKFTDDAALYATAVEEFVL